MTLRTPPIMRDMNGSIMDWLGQSSQRTALTAVSCSQSWPLLRYWSRSGLPVMRLGMDAPLRRYQPGEVGPLYWPTNLMAKVDWVWMRSSLPDSWVNVSVVRSSGTVTPWVPGRTRMKGRPKADTEGAE